MKTAITAIQLRPQITPCIEFTPPTVTPCVDVELECEARMAGFAIRRFLDLAAR